MKPTSIKRRSLRLTSRTPSPDLRGPVEYKKGLVKELAKRALTRAYRARWQQ